MDFTGTLHTCSVVAPAKPCIDSQAGHRLQTVGMTWTMNCALEELRSHISSAQALATTERRMLVSTDGSYEPTLGNPAGIVALSVSSVTTSLPACNLSLCRPSRSLHCCSACKLGV